MTTDVLIIGAGPVGLFTAIEIKLLNPKLQIKILERKSEYTRSHILSLEKKSLLNSQAYGCFPEVRKLKGFVPTSDIEGTFLKIALKLGIEIERNKKVEDANALFAEYPVAKSIIGADGANSLIRKQLFNNETIVNHNLQYIVEIKYFAQGSTKRLPSRVYGAALGQVNHLVSENIGKEKEGKTPVSLFVFVDEKTYNAVRAVPNAKMLDLQPNTDFMEKLLNTLRPWLALRRVSAHEKMLADSEKINAVALNVYQAASFAKTIQGKNVYLVGDAAAGVPYFRALNAGLIAAQVTATAIAMNPDPDLNNLNKKLTALSNQEISGANKTNKTVNIGRTVNYVLASATRLTTGSVLTDNEEKAILNARVKRPNMFRRHPRYTLGALLFAAITAFTLPAYMAIYPMFTGALLASATYAAIVVLILQCAFKLYDFILGCIDPVLPLPAFPWELDMAEVNASSKAMAQLGGGCNTLAAAAQVQVAHHKPLFAHNVGIEPQQLVHAPTV